MRNPRHRLLDSALGMSSRVAERAALDRWPVLVAAGCLLYAVFLVACAPASVFAWGLALATGGTAMLERAHGSFWRGAAALVIAMPGLPPQRIERMTWTVEALRMLRGQLGVRMAFDDSAIKGAGTLAFAPRSLRLLQTALTLSAAELAKSFPLLQIVRPGGAVSLAAEDLLIGDDAVSGHATLEWAQASSALTAVSPLGTYRVRLEGRGGPAQVQLATVDGALLLEGRGSWSPAKGLSFTGIARAAPSQAANLQDLLRLLGPEGANGTRQLSFGRR